MIFKANSVSRSFCLYLFMLSIFSPLLAAENEFVISIPAGYTFSGHPEHIQANEHGIFLRLNKEGEKKGGTLAVYDSNLRLHKMISVDPGYWIANYSVVGNPTNNKPMLMLVSLRQVEKDTAPEKRVFFYDFDGTPLGIAFDQSAENKGRAVYFRQIFDTGDYLIANTWLYGGTGNAFSNSELVEMSLLPVKSNPFDDNDTQQGFLIQYLGGTFLRRPADTEDISGWSKLVFPVLLDGSLVVMEQLNRRMNRIDRYRKKADGLKLVLPKNGPAAFVPANQKDSMGRYTQTTGAYKLSDGGILVTWKNPVSSEHFVGHNKNVPGLDGFRHFAQIFDGAGNPLGILNQMEHRFICGTNSDSALVYEQVNGKHMISSVQFSQFW